MLDLKDIYARKKEASGQVSTLTRALALGFLGVSWTLLTAHDEPLHTMAANVNKYLILSLAVVSGLVLAFDIFQYVAITSMAEEAYRRAEDVGHKEAQYDSKSTAYKAQGFFYHAKFATLIIGSLLLVFVFVRLFLGISKLQQTPLLMPCTAANVQAHDTTPKR